MPHLKKIRFDEKLEEKVEEEPITLQLVKFVKTEETEESLEEEVAVAYEEELSSRQKSHF